MTTTQVSLKLLVDTKSNKVLYAEARKDFVDFLIQMMYLSVGTITKLLNVKDMVGCAGSLYKSIESINSDYFQLKGRKYVNKQNNLNNVALLSAGGETSSGKQPKGYVKELVTYMVTDNLEVKPMSNMSGISLINKFRVKDISSVVEKNVVVGLTERIAIAKASLETQAVLTTVLFLRNKA